jgi:hypothetical protein
VEEEIFWVEMESEQGLDFFNHGGTKESSSLANTSLL